MANDQGKGAGKQALAPEVLAARAAEQRERDAAALAEREYDLARQSAAANADGNGHLRERVFGRGYYGPPPPQPQLDAGVADFAPSAPQSVMDTTNAFAAVTQAMKAIADSLDCPALYIRHSKIGHDSLGHVNISYMRWIPTILHKRVAL